MNMKPLPPLDILRQLLEYDPETGTLRYRERTDFRFAPTPTGKFSQANQLAQWNGRFAGKVASSGRRAGNGYLVTKLLGEQYKTHRLIWLMHYGAEPTGQIDHINGDRADNRIANLRDVEYIDNAHNRALPRNNTSGFHGVKREKNRWVAVIRVGGRQVRLGTWMTKEEAVAARKAAERLLGYHPNHGRAA